MALTLNIGYQSVDLDITAASVILTIDQKSIALSSVAAEVDIQTYIPGPIGPPGLTGPPGPEGGAGYILTAGENLGSNRAIATINGLAYYAACDGDVFYPVIGLSMGAVTGGADVTVQSSGKMTVTGMTWIPNLPLFLSNNGTLTQIEPTIGYSQVLGIAHLPDVILIDIHRPIKVT